MSQWSFYVPLEKESSSTDHTIPLVARSTNHSLEDLSVSVYPPPKGWRLWLHRLKDLCRLVSPVALLLVLISTSLVLAIRFPFHPVASNPPLVPGLGRSSILAESEDHDSGAPFAPASVQKLWGTYSPYYAVERYQPPPENCQLTQVNILHRHSSRYPSHGQRKHFRQALDRLQSAKSYRRKELQFLAKYKYKLHSNRMIPYGELELLESGRKAFSRYVNLASEQNLPFIRAAGGECTFQSALKWAEGFGSGSNGVMQPPLALATPSYSGFNTTLHDGNCPKAKGSKAEVRTWQHIYAKPIADRLNSGAKGLKKKLSPKDVQYLMELCAFETLAKEKYSPFCELFTEEEFEGFEYALDLGRFYSVGYGSQLGPVQGVGYVNELLARLTDQPVRDNTQTNRTLDSNPATFPLGRGIYADFTHGSLIVSVISAMGIRNSSEFEQSLGGGEFIMNPTKLNKDRTWVLSKMVPFSGRLVVERMECGLPSTNVTGDVDEKLERKRQQRREAEGRDSSTYVRVLMNDAVQVDICGGTGEDGLCSLQEFVRSQEYAREDGKGDWEKCFK